MFVLLYQAFYFPAEAENSPRALGGIKLQGTGNAPSCD